MSNNIPSTIHYCWFGGKEKPEIVKRCLDSWGKHLQDYEIIEWNESNFNIDQNAYVKQAFDYGKYAFVSDYVRVYALYHNGGIYLDTDVEVFKSFDDLLHHESFWGFEQGNFIATSTIGATRENRLIKSFLDSYESRTFIKGDGSLDELTNVATVTNILIDMGLKRDGNYQEIKGIGAFYPQSFFSPYDYINCRSLKNENTYAMHHFYKSWLPLKARVKSSLKNKIALLIGGDNIARLRRFSHKSTN
ncbi:glycosyltransferase [Rossellomorea vietnamensis]|uniref:Glycosyltransferase n=1 Tax=Rossellomorea vietnamensis TaxID=218284 RepID=A0ACD4C2X6_9BACI|nr:capsular polysaccharide synthesis protein [Rossellomorea vietnamensis]UXH42759.1 glycosyltransferase [Rossellomorea vietnamensis]